MSTWQVRSNSKQLFLVLNDLSLHGQFNEKAGFRAAIDRLMVMRSIARRHGEELKCHRNVAYAKVMHGRTIQQAVGILSKDKRSALLQWLTRSGPFWEDVRRHSPDDWLEYNCQIVTDTALGEAAHCVINDIDCALVSLDPSLWLTSPLRVHYRRENGTAKSAEVPNYWVADRLDTALANAQSPPESWSDFAETARRRFPGLTFSPSTFENLHGHPFNKSAAERLLWFLDVLSKFKSCFNERGERTPEGQDLYKQHFTGDKWFSDSSEREKADFRKSLTFPHPRNIGETLFCTWHGKVRMAPLPLRIHFTWPIRANEPLYVVYIGAKITRR